jgi:hypothetical protein
MNRSVSLLLVGAALTLSGCSAISGHRVIDPANGEDVHGLPIVVQRPRYLKVTYKEVDYGFLLTSMPPAGAKPAAAPGAAPGAGETPAPAPGAGMTQTIQSARTSVEVQIDTIDVGEVYAIDIKRPFSGSADLGIEFDPGKQYPKNVRSKVDDNTLKTMSDAIGNILSKFVKGVGTEGVAPPAANEVVLSSRIVKIEVYDLDHLNAPPVCVLGPQGQESHAQPQPAPATK